MALHKTNFQDGFRFRRFLRLCNHRLFIMKTRQSQDCLFFILHDSSPPRKLRDFARFLHDPLHALHHTSPPLPTPNPDPATPHTWNSATFLVYLSAGQGPRYSRSLTTPLGNRSPHNELLMPGNHCPHTGQGNRYTSP